MIKAKVGKCSDCSKETSLTAGRCQYCYWKHRAHIKRAERREIAVVSVKKQTKPIRRLSKKRAAQNVLYLKKRRIFMQQNNTCQAKLPSCSYWATEIHHKKGRVGILLTDDRFFLSVCRSCHDYIEENAEYAKSMGFSESRL